MIKDLRGIVDYTCKQLKNFTDIAVIGMSGGADSALVATLCTIALGKENVYGYGLPFNNFDAKTFNANSRKVARKLGIEYTEISIGATVEMAQDSLNNVLRRNINSMNLGNIKSRMRMIYLYSLCAQIGEICNLRARVIGTGNLSEDYIGYDTKGGDALADIFPIGSLFKSEVYQLLDYLVEMNYLEEDMIDRVPSAGLQEGQTDEGDLGYSYDEMEPVIRFALGEVVSGPIPCLDLLNFVNDRHDANKHKHETVPIIDLKEFKYDY